MKAGQHAEKPERRFAHGLVSFAAIVVVVAAITAFLRLFIFVPYEIPTGSMEDTILVGDMVFSEKVSYYFRAPERGDIVTFTDPEMEGRTLIKRVIATAGQTVDLRDGVVYVDGALLEEGYTGGQESWPLARTAEDVSISYPYTVPAGSVWVMGDNREHSQDSRYFGAVDVESINGRASIVYWPLSHIGLLS